MRTSFIKKVEEMAREDSNLYFLTGDLGFSVVENFQKEFPERFFNVGVAEQTLAGVAAGLALSGKTIFIYSIASFAVMRCFEQIRNDIAYHNLKVRIVGVGSGFSYSAYGVTHHSLSDVAIMRCLPNMTIIAPGDPIEVEKTMEKSKFWNGPIYFRLAKKGEPRLHPESINIEIGKGIVLKKGEDVALISSGNTLELTKEVSDFLEEKGISTQVISMHTIKPLDKDLILETISKIKNIFTIEEHNIIGGLGSAVAEVISESQLNKEIFFKRFGVEDKFCTIAGDHNYIRNSFNMSKEKISSFIISLLKK
ncbi:MAG: 1-deoxy-D-xylulose-5-phosphate synthase [Nanoarchaeota archaeon]|nr:1-deoxy-D-xylulose-5-phosphate synthase [Nanoarchaeota archaeon]